MSAKTDFDYVKSHGLGNDYLVMDTTSLDYELTPDRIEAICHRNMGVGSDGVLALVETSEADFAVRILNPDGTEAEKSGNGLRIFSKFLFDHGYTTKTDFTVHTIGGTVDAHLFVDEGRVSAVRVDMGMATIDHDLTSILVDGDDLPITSISVGNPHCVSLVDDLSQVDLFHVGPIIEIHEAFPNRTNVQFAEVISNTHVKAIIWERGAGHTLASGSSSCAVAVACYDKGLVGDEVTVVMEGGDLSIKLDPDLNMVMTGGVEETSIGTFSVDFRRRLLALG